MKRLGLYLPLLAPLAVLACTPDAPTPSLPPETGNETASENEVENENKTAEENELENENELDIENGPENEVRFPPLLPAADVTSAARSLNQGRHAAPPLDDPTAGAPRVVAAPRRPLLESRTADRFVLRLPEPLPVPTPTVHRGHILVGTGLWYGAVDRRGDLVWGRKPVDMNPSSAACEGELCAWNTYSCTVIVAEADTGETRHVTWLAPTVLSAPSVRDGTLYAAFTTDRHRIGDNGEIANGGIAALDLPTGKVRWRRWLDRDAVGAPVVGGGAVHVSTWGGTLMSFAEEDGAIHGAQAQYAAGRPTWHRERLHFARLQRNSNAWRVDLLGMPAPARADETPAPPQWHLASSPAPRGLAQRRRLYPGYDRDAFFPPETLDWPAPSRESRSAIGHAYGVDEMFGGASPVHAGETTAVVLGDRLVAVRGGRVAWTRDLSGVYAQASLRRYFNDKAYDEGRAYGMRAMNGYPPAALSASRERVVATTLDGRALILDAESGQLQQTIALEHPVITEAVLDDGWIYVGTVDGRLVAVNTADPAVDGWSSYGGNARRDGHPDA